MEKKFENYAIKYTGLKLGKHHFEYQIDNKFFDDFDYQELQKTDIQTFVCLDKKNTQLEFDINIKGTVRVNCDLTLEPFDLPIENSMFFIVKFGDKFEEIDDKLLTIPRGEHEFNIKQYIYECILLALPSKRIHPGVKDGSLNSDILDKLNHHSVENVNKKNTNQTDPRWDKLKTLLNE